MIAIIPITMTMRMRRRTKRMMTRKERKEKTSGAGRHLSFGRNVAGRQKVFLSIRTFYITVVAAARSAALCDSQPPRRQMRAMPRATAVSISARFQNGVDVRLARSRRARTKSWRMRAPIRRVLDLLLPSHQHAMALAEIGQTI